MIRISPSLTLHETELHFTFMRSPGPGGQNVNKVATAVQLRFDIAHSPSLPQALRERFLKLYRSKITLQGEIIIKATTHRTQERNKEAALQRLLALLNVAAQRPKKRKKSKPSRAAIEKRLSKKKRHSKTKALRGKKTLREN